MKPDGPPKDIIEAWKEICRESGSTRVVGPDYYLWFIELFDEEMIHLLELLVLARADELNSWAFAKARTKTDQDILRYMEQVLGMFGRGFFQINSDGGLGCCAPEGPEPTALENRAIDLRVQSCRPLFRRAFLNAVRDRNEMAIPTFDKCLRPVLALAINEDITRRSATEAMAREFNLSPAEIEQRLPSGGAKPLTMRL